MNNKKLWQARNYVKEMMKEYKVSQYMNIVIADALASGHKEQMNSDWLRRFLFQNIEDGFIKSENAVALNRIYTKVIENYR